MISINNLTKKYGDLTVLDDIDLSIEDGDVFGIVGVSGAGKSTILRCLNGTETIDSGSIVVDGQEISKLDAPKLREFRKNMGFIFQQFSLMERDTVSQNIELPMKLWKYSREQRIARVDELLKIVSLEDKRNSKPRELSGGQKQRVAIARALAMNPKYLLCDEATSALDPMNTRSVLETLQQINRDSGVTIILVTHEMSVIKAICNKLAIVENGKIVATGPVNKVFIEAPSALTHLLGNENTENLPENGHNFRISFSDDNIMNDIIRTILGAGDISIENIKTEVFKDGKVCEMIVNAAQSDASAIRSLLSEHDVYLEEISE